MKLDLRTRPDRPLVAASVLSADFMAMGDAASGVLTEGADLLHIDVMDGHFVPNLTMGPDMVRGLRRVLPDAYLDVHLMVENPERFFEPFAEAGADHATFHAEPFEAGELGRVTEAARRAGLASVGVAINPATPADAILGVLDAVDLVLVMSVVPGYSGQAFMPEVLEKARAISGKLRPDQRLEIDGGVSPETAPLAREAGCDVLAAASSIFKQPRERWRDVMERMRGA